MQRHIIGIVILFFLSCCWTVSTFASELTLDFNDNNQLIMAVQLEDGTFMSDGLDVYRSGTQWFVPLSSLVESLGLAITVSPALGQAEGYYLEENRLFKMDKTTCTATSYKETQPFDCGLVVTYDDEIFVESGLLEKWFHLRMRMDTFSATISIRSEDKFPKQLRMERDHRAEPTGSKDNRAPEGYNDQKLEDKTVGEGSFDQQLTLGQQRVAGEEEAYFRHDTIAAIELFGFETKGFLGGKNDHLTESSLSISKKDPNAELLGAMKARSFELLDLTLPSLPLIASSTRAQGVLVSSYPLTQPENFSTRDFRGPLPSNWEVELYQNDIFIGRRVADSATEYEFKEVTLYYGVNRFRLLFYGPQGQRKEITEIVSIGQESSKPAESYYRFGSGTDVNDPALLRTVAQFQYGFSSQLSASANYYQENDRDLSATTNYGLLNVNGNFSRFFGTLNLAGTDKSGQAFEATLQAPFERFVLGLSHTNLSNFKSSLFNSTDVRLLRQVDKFNGNLTLAPYLPLRFDLEVKQNQYENSDQAIEFKQRTFLQVGNTYWFNTFTEDSESDKGLQGELLTILPVDRYEFRTTVDYNTSLAAAGASLTYRISDKYSYEIEGTHDLTKNLTTYSGTLNRLLHYVTVSAEVTADSNDDYRAIGLISYSGTYSPRSKTFEWSPRAQTSYGAVSVRVFLDQDYNGVFSEGDVPLKDIGLRVNQNDVDTETDATGEAMLLGLPVHQATDISLALKSLPDPFYHPSKKGIRLIPRPGQVCQLEFPVTLLSEIDGLVQIEKTNGRRGLRNMTVNLKKADGTVVASAKTESDGFYLLTDIPPGEYVLSVDTDQTKNLGLLFSQTSYNIAVTNAGLQQSTFDFFASNKRSNKR